MITRETSKLEMCGTIKFSVLLTNIIGKVTLLNVNQRREKFASANITVRTALYNIMHNAA